MVLHPAAENAGLVFRRVDLPGLPQLRAGLDTARVTERGLSLTAGELRIDGVELLLAAFAGCGIDNVLVELDGPEIPDLDGSAATFTFLIACAGRAPQEARRKAVEVKRTVRLSAPGRYALLRPGAQPRIRLREPAGKRRGDYDLRDGDFARELASARRVFEADRIDELLDRGLLRGWTPGRSLMRSDGRLSVPGGLRFPDEDLRFGLCRGLGLLGLLGGALEGSLLLRGAGPGMTLRLLRRLMAEEASYGWKEIAEPAATAWPEAVQAVGAEPGEETAEALPQGLRNAHQAS